MREGRLLITFSVTRLLCDKNTSTYYPARLPYPSNPTTPRPSHCLDTVISSLDSLASVVALCEWNDGVKRCVSEWRSENSFELDRCVSVIVHTRVVQLLDVGVMGLGFVGRTWSARILWLLQISSLSLYIEMPLAHAKPNANDVIRVPNIFSPYLFFLSFAIGWSLRRLYLVATYEYPA